MITGILAVDKPVGWTSHDVVARVRTLTGQKQVGHAGTLDPLASGVLLLVLGQATRLSSYLMAQPKVYCADVVLGATTATDDAEASLATRADPSHISQQEMEACLSRFVGEVEQVPPAYAAVRHEGKKLYQLARNGKGVEAEPRRVAIHGIEMEDWEPPRVRIRVGCGSGTYIRSLARDIGTALSVGAYLHGLRRVASGTFTVDECLSFGGPLPPDPSPSEARGKASADNVSEDDARVLMGGGARRKGDVSASPLTPGPSPSEGRGEASRGRVAGEKGRGMFRGARREAIEAAVQPGDRAVLHLPALVLPAGDVRSIRMGQPVVMSNVEGDECGRPGGVSHAGGREVRLYGSSGTLIALGREAEGLIKPFRVFGGPEEDESRL